MTNLKQDAIKTPLFHAVVILLFSAGGLSIPLNKLFDLFIFDATVSLFVSGIIVRAIISVLAIIFVFKYGFNKIFSFKFSAITLLALLPALIVCINNFPIISAFTGEVTFTQNITHIVLFTFYCLSVACAEELCFRGLIFPCCAILFKDKNSSVFLSVLLSSVMFSFAHAVAFFNGNITGSLLQLGYTFLIGGMCAISMLKSKNIYFAVLFHFVYDIGGLSVGLIASGNQWNTATVIITATVGVLVTGYMVYLMFNTDKKVLNEMFLSDYYERNGQ